MTQFPPRQKLVHVAACLVRQLPDRFATLLAAEPFADGRGAVGRLADPAALAAGAAVMAPEEAAWMADLLLERWGRIDTVELEPAAAILGPDDVWVAGEARAVTLDLALLGLESDWEADWSGDVTPSKDGRQAALPIVPLIAGGRPICRARVRVIGRAGAKRAVVTATHDVRVRQSVVSLSADRLTFTLRDQSGAPGHAVPVSIDGADHLTDSDGTVVLTLPAPADATILVDGQPTTVTRPQPEGGR